MTRKVKPRNKLSKLIPDTAKARLGMKPVARRQETRLEIRGGEPDLAALGLVTRDWLVPLLVEKFLRKHGVELRASRTAARLQLNRLSTKKSNTAPINKGDAD